MNKTTRNPAYENAQYELGWMKDDKMLHGIDPYPKRFKHPPPEDVWQSPNTLWQWVLENEVPQFIESE